MKRRSNGRSIGRMKQELLDACELEIELVKFERDRALETADAIKQRHGARSALKYLAAKTAAVRRAIEQRAC